MPLSTLKIESEREILKAAISGSWDYDRGPSRRQNRARRERPHPRGGGWNMADLVMERHDALQVHHVDGAT